MNNDKLPQSAHDILKAASFFSDLTPDARTSLERAASRRTYNTEQAILLEGDPCSGMYILEDGWLKVSKIGMDGREQILKTLKSGDVFNALSVFTDAPSQATITALETSTIWLIQRKTLIKLINEYPSLAHQVIGELAGKVQYLIRMVEDLSLRSVEARLARLLLEQAQDESVQRQRWATQAEMSSRLGTVPDVLNRALRKLAEKKMIRVERHQIQILDKEGLKTIAQIIE
jgi:CRP/FNR family transcriptional regulator, dissimilatory nitrate respiration regulator